METQQIFNNCLVLCCVTLLLTLESGVMKSLSVLLPSIREQFVTKTWVIGLAIALIPGIGSMACLFLPALRKWDINPGYVIMFGGSITGMGLVIASVCQHLPGLVLSILLQSFMAITKVSSLAILKDFFVEETLDIANAIATCGMSLGIILLPPTTQILLDTYGWRGALWILGALTFNSVVCGEIIKYFENHNRIGNLIAPQYRQLNGYNSGEGSQRSKTTSSTLSIWTKVLSLHSKLLNLKLLNNVSFLNVLVGAAAFGWSYNCWLIYLIPHAEEKGIAPVPASLLGTIGGISNMLGKLSFPTTKEVMSNRAGIYVSCMISAVSLVVDPWTDSFTGMGICTAVYGFATGFACVACFAVMNDALETADEALDALSWFYVIYGPFAIAGGFTSGWFFDQTGSYDVSFMLMGGFMLLPPLTFGVEDLYRTMGNYK